MPQYCYIIRTLGGALGGVSGTQRWRPGDRQKERATGSRREGWGRLVASRAREGLLGALGGETWFG